MRRQGCSSTATRYCRGTAAQPVVLQHNVALWSGHMCRVYVWLSWGSLVQVFEFVADQAGSPGYVGAAVTNKTQVGAPGWGTSPVLGANTRTLTECAPS